MDINDLDDDELVNLARWLAAAPAGAVMVDLRTAPAWRFAQARIAVDRGEITKFPDVLSEPGAFPDDQVRAQ